MLRASGAAPAGVSIGRGRGRGREPDAAATSRIGAARRRAAPERAALVGVVALAAVLGLWGLTQNGYANSYYASAVLAGTRSWSAYLSAALDPSGYVSVDKPPLSLWMMGLSARVLGFGSFSMLLPNVLCQIGSVLLLNDAVARSAGRRAGLLAALLLAVTPVAVVMSRFNNPDALLTLLLVGSAWTTVRALQSGATRWIALAGVLVGLAFNTKMLQAYLVLPALSGAYLSCGPGRIRRRLGQLGAGAGAVVGVSALWVAATLLIPAASRPWVGDTTNNSWLQLVFAGNGVGRLGSVTAPGAGGTGLLRLFAPATAGQVAWLLPLAAAGAFAGLWISRRGPRASVARGAVVMWTAWGVLHFLVFSVALNVFHPYYTVALAPAVAALAATGLTTLWDLAPRRREAGVALAVMLLVTAAVSLTILGRTPAFVPWLRWLVAALAAIGAAAALVAHRRAVSTPALLVASRGTALACLVAGPLAFSFTTLGRSIMGTNPLAGPVAYTPVSAAHPPATSALADPSTSPLARLHLGRQLLGFLERHRGRTRYLVAASGSIVAAPIFLASRQPVITLGGFAGSDPAPSVAVLRRLAARGAVRYFLVDVVATQPNGLGGDVSRRRWLTASCRPVRYSAAQTLVARGERLTLFDCAGASPRRVA